MIKVFRSFKYVIIPSLQSGFLMSAGDIIAQTVVERKSLKEVNLVRTGQFACVGIVLSGPVLSTWYRILAKRLGTTGGLVTLKKVALDQCCFAPCFLLVLLSTLGTIQGDRPDKIMANIRKNYPDVLVTNYKLWPAVQLVNFYFTPLRHQVLLVQFVALIFNTYISWKTQSGRDLEK